MSQQYSDNVSLNGTVAGIKAHADLVQRGLQSRTRAIMALYGVTRAEAEKIMTEIQEEAVKYGPPVILPFPDEN